MINQNVFLYGFLMFITVFIIHIVIWRFLKPKSHIKSLLLNFGIPFVIIIFFGLIFIKFQIQFIKPEDLMLILILYSSISGVYIQTYPAIQAWSPSLYILYIIKKSSQSVTIDLIEKKIDEKQLVKDRFNDLVDEKLIKVHEDKIVSLSGKGKILANIFFYYRNIIGLKEGDG